MRIGVMSGTTEGTLDDLVARGRRLEQAGFHTMWMANIFALDAITALAVVGRETSRIELGTAVVPTYPRHPVAMAQQALTAGAAAGGRFTLGIGLSHRIVIEDMLGLSYAKPAGHMREYLEVLTPLLRGEPAQHEGARYAVKNVQIQVPGAERVPLLVAALGPVMLRLAGAFADGTITWVTGPRTLAEHIGPRIREAAKEAGRPEPRVVAGLPIVLTSDVDAACEKIAKQLAIYGQLPSYRSMLDREGADGPADIALVGDEKALDDGLARLRDAGVTDFDAAIVPVDEGAEARTIDFLASRL
ncbi:MAG: TIGR03564 family F420-dependent LLM class oxidoreductase [Myxococcota bacterium]|nr:TIGR03564 family F420-dependent LLM class oxidoreductase [Myxococcota bacterium]